MRRSLISKITNYIFLESNPRKADLAIVFGTRHKEPLDKVYKLYKNGLIPKILVSGGINKITKENEAEKMAENLIKLGVKREDIILENKSANTLENVQFSREIIEKKIGFRNIKKIIAVVKHYHSRRALMTLKKHFPESVKFSPVTYGIYGFTKNDWFKHKIGQRKVLSEWNKIKKYLKKGDIEELEVAPKSKYG